MVSEEGKNIQEIQICCFLESVGPVYICVTTLYYFILPCRIGNWPTVPYLNNSTNNSTSSKPPQIYYNLSRSKSVCDLSMEQNSQLLNCSEKCFTIERKRVIERKPNPAAAVESKPESSGTSCPSQQQQQTHTQTPTTHRSRVVRNRTILGSFPLFYKLSQSLSSLNTKSDISAQMGSDNCGAFYMDDTYSDR